MSWFRIRPWGIRLKMTLITLTLIATTTFGSFIVITSVMNDFLLDSLLERGESIAMSAATPAGFNILADNQLALDNLVAKIKESQPDVAYISIVDHKGVILAHSRLSAVGETFADKKGRLIENLRSVKVKEIQSDGVLSYQIKAPVRFADNRVGDVIVGLKTDTMLAARQAAHRRIFWISVLAMSFGAVGTLILASFLTAPIERLAAGVSRLQSGHKNVEIRVTSRDELGELTRSFNEMSKTLLAQQESLKKYSKNLEDSYTSMVRILAAALDARDQYTLGHSERVALLALRIGRKLGLDEQELKDLEIACFLHDIGKIRIPDMILAKTEPLSEKEYEIIKQHPGYGAGILKLSVSLHKYIPAVLQHHEWYNGQGYPNGLKGEQIHLYAQIVAIADCYDAMTTSRPYRTEISESRAAREIEKYKGIRFSPHLVDIFIETLDDFDKEETISFPGGAV
ncbi:MAG: HD domain-containing protein [Desulfobacteraceae bacterium]|nr:HD domain-containing protein [Desulfobacteraceae bacterium]